MATVDEVKGLMQYSDVNNTLSTGIDGNITIAYGVDAVKGSVVNILSTMRGERPMLRDFGASLRSLLFEAADEKLKTVVISMIQKEIAKWDPRPRIDDIVVDIDPDGHSMNMKIACTVIMTGAQFVAEVSL